MNIFSFLDKISNYINCKQCSNRGVCFWYYGIDVSGEIPKYCKSFVAE